MSQTAGQICLLVDDGRREEHTVEIGRRLMRVNETERGIHRRPLVSLAYVVHVQRTVGEGPACQIVARQKVEVNTQFSLVESFRDDRLVESVRERDRRFLSCNCSFL